MPSVSEPALGAVYLVGAGAGDPDFLTLGAVKALQAATFILLDKLANPAVLQHANPQAQIHDVGKRGGCKSVSQQSINERMLAAALEGHTVVRLKGGEPLIFGRAGEELAFLREHGVRVHLVPGVTASVAAARALQISLTHRSYAQGFLCLTGHGQKTTSPANSANPEDIENAKALGGVVTPSDPNTPEHWARVGESVRDLSLTLCVYMGLRQLPVIQAGLLRSLDPQTSTALVASASTPEQQIGVASLQELLLVSAQFTPQSPVLLLLGGSLKELQGDWSAIPLAATG